MWILYVKSYKSDFYLLTFILHILHIGRSGPVCDGVRGAPNLWGPVKCRTGGSITRKITRKQNGGVSMLCLPMQALCCILYTR